VSIRLVTTTSKTPITVLRPPNLAKTAVNVERVVNAGRIGATETDQEIAVRRV